MMNQREIEAKVREYAADKEYNRTPLMWAARAREVEVVRFLLTRLSQKQLQEELDKQDSWGWTPLHLACFSLKPKLEIIELLLAHGARTDIKDDQDETPLIKSVTSGYPDVVQMILQHGVAVTGEDGREALERAESSGFIAITNMLKQAGAGV